MVLSITLRCKVEPERLCLGQGCKRCPVYLEAMMHVDSKFCPVCGADLDAWRETFGEEHHCVV